MGYLQISVLAVVLTAVVALQCGDEVCPTCAPGQVATCDHHHDHPDHGHQGHTGCHCHHEHNAVGRQVASCQNDGCDNKTCPHGHMAVCGHANTHNPDGCHCNHHAHTAVGRQLVASCNNDGCDSHHCPHGHTAFCGHADAHQPDGCHCRHHQHNAVGRQAHDCCDGVDLGCRHGETEVCVSENHHHVCRCTAHHG